MAAHSCSSILFSPGYLMIFKPSSYRCLICSNTTSPRSAPCRYSGRPRQSSAPRSRCLTIQHQLQWQHAVPSHGASAVLHTLLLQPKLLLSVQWRWVVLKRRDIWTEERTTGGQLWRWDGPSPASGAHRVQEEPEHVTGRQGERGGTVCCVWRQGLRIPLQCSHLWGM